MDSPLHFTRELPAGMGQAVAERTVLRKKENGELEDWGDVAKRVAAGNCSLDPNCNDKEEMEALIASGALMMSGRHLQQGDAEQSTRTAEIFLNCSTSPTSFLLFYNLLNGAGVGRAYDDDMMLVNWDYAPSVWCVLDESHPDYSDGQHLSARNARHMFDGSKDMLWFEVPDSREGWAKALELVEIAAFEKIHKDKLLILDFSKVRPKGAPIKGMQDRPSSGPQALMNAFQKISMVCGAGLPRWKQTMYIDHFMSECVLVGGARRAARMSTKYWKDKSILEFITVKRPVEYEKLNYREIRELKGEFLGFLWSSNNSIAVDQEFWDTIVEAPNDSWARLVFDRATECAYGDGTGEPGFINVDKLKQDDTGWEDLSRGDYARSSRYQPEDNTNIYMAKLAKKAQSKKYHTIVNPCGEIPLNMLGGYCTLGAVAPYHCMPMVGGKNNLFHVDEWDDRFEQAVRMAVRALIRVNLMDSLYKKEVERTNRIGVGLIGIHEWMWARFGLTFKQALELDDADDIVWYKLSHMRDAAIDEAKIYSEKLGVTMPHTVLTIPPGGTISKLFNITEGAHLPAMKQYLRWVQFRDDDPLVQAYQEKGYPTRVLKQYKGHTIVGFPTQTRIAKIMPQDKVVIASEATPEEQYKWIQLLEKHWLGEEYGSQISYTLKFDPKDISLKQFQNIIKEYQSSVKCCSIMPFEKSNSYEYLPEEEISFKEYEKIKNNIEQIKEDVDVQSLKCNGSSCSFEYNTEKGVIQEYGYY